MKGKSNAPFVTEISTHLAAKMLSDLKAQGFSIDKPEYTLFSAKKKGVSCTLYESGKLVVQGKDKGEFLEFYLEPQILKDFNFSYGEVNLDLNPRIGSDEAGKGDFFGPLSVVSLYAEGEGVKRLQELGVRDSKGISDKVIWEIAEKLEKEYIHHAICLYPEKYNELYPKFGSNLNKLLAWAHSAAIAKVVEASGCRDVIIDQFASEWVMERAIASKKLDIALTQRTKAEEDLVVAAASIIARKKFLEGLRFLEKQGGVVLPKGGSSPKVLAAGKEFIAKFGKEQLNKVAKLHFKTLNGISS